MPAPPLFSVLAKPSSNYTVLNVNHKQNNKKTIIYLLLLLLLLLLLFYFIVSIFLPLIQFRPASIDLL